MNLTRRRFLRSAAAAAAGLGVAGPMVEAFQVDVGRRGPQRPDLTPRRPRLSDTYADLPRHFLFEYYPWYGTSPWQHWNGSQRNPPVDIASNYMPALGPYDSGSMRVIEQHARWIRESGVGAINLSWWGRDSVEDRRVPAIMDVMAAHDIHVTFHLEPYNNRHALSYADDIRYLIAKYGEARRWDCFLLLEDANGRSRPVFKSFATILPTVETDCHGVTSPKPDYTPINIWRQQTDSVRQTFRGEFDGITLLADSLNFSQTVTGGFDGIAIYDNYVKPDTWRGHAQNAAANNLLFSFNINAGFDGVALRQVDPGSCYAPLPFEPGGRAYDWSRASDRDAAEALTRTRIQDSFATTLRLQTNPALTNAQRGFLLVYINSFNEWHEGDQFEPEKDRADLTPDERAIGYHNSDNGAWRLELLTDLLTGVL